MTAIYIAAARRTPIGKLSGSLSSLSGAELGARVISGIIAETDIDPAEIDDVIIGQVLTGGAGQNPARQAALSSGIPNSVPAMTVNMVCGGGQRSLHLAAQAIKAGDAGLVIAGGQDSMSQAPHYLQARAPTKFGDRVARDMMVTDGLWDAFHDVHMGHTAEHLATQFQISREQQDRFALESQRKAVAAMQANSFSDELIVIEAKDGRKVRIVDTDEHPRPGSSLQQLAELTPVFDNQGSVTAGNSAGLNDGAAHVLIGSEDRLNELGLAPLARIVSYASAALEPMEMGLGPALASQAALKKAGWSKDEPEIIELNEAFAAQAIAVLRMMNWDPELVNPNGGAIALGHPLAGTGCRIVVALVHEMIKRKAKKGLAAQCIGGGQGVAICLEAA